MTNGDRIRKMTNEELAESVVSGELDPCTHCEFYDGEILKCRLDNPCVKELACTELLDWLSSEAVSKCLENPSAPPLVQDKG